MEDRKYLIWLSRIQNLDSNTKTRLLEKYNKLERLWKLDKENLKQINGINDKMADEMLNNEYRQGLERYSDYMEKNNIGIITIKDKKYPNKLKEIYDPPAILYFKGNIDILDNFSIGIIGCRLCSEYGKQIAQDISFKLSKHNVNIISGLALGIDVHAHIGCIKANGKTVAIIGNGLDNIYPSDNKKIADQIIETGGCILSEYIIGTKPKKENFPARNRIISGISDGILVVEAKQKSGTFITVDFALEQGRDVFAVPGNINQMNSMGTNELIKNGAKTVTRVEDIIEEYQIK